MPLGQVAVIDELAAHPRQHVHRRLQARVAHRVPRQEGVPVGVEQPAVEGRDPQRRAAEADQPEERRQARPEGRRHRQQALGEAQIVRPVARDGVQAVRLAVVRILAQRQQFARLGVEDEEQPVEHDQRVVINLLQRRRIGPQLVARIIEEPLRQVPQRVVDLRLQRVADVPRVVAAGRQQRIERQRPAARHERGAAKRA